MIGISFHVGSGCMDPPVYAKAIQAARKLFDFARSVGFEFTLLDIGGGFPGDKGTDIKEVSPKSPSESIESNCRQAAISIHKQ